LIAEWSVFEAQQIYDVLKFASGRDRSLADHRRHLNCSTLTGHTCGRAPSSINDPLTRRRRAILIGKEFVSEARYVRGEPPVRPLLTVVQVEPPCLVGLPRVRLDLHVPISVKDDQTVTSVWLCSPCVLVTVRNLHG
jgi:hypothetical protein